jgi:hypothetical protein
MFLVCHVKQEYVERKLLSAISDDFEGAVSRKNRVGCYIQGTVERKKERKINLFFIYLQNACCVLGDIAKLRNNQIIMEEIVRFPLTLIKI